ncbi:MAG: hypothetical protein EP349_09315 [Alphaproteobacteria bacterium]|nr:MAG: hypothetical protein EP349_09315 [Alphaproteobacteria bacterium]
MFFDPTIVVQPDFRDYLAPVAAMMSCNEYRSSPAIHITIDDVPVKYDTSRSYAELQNFHIDTISPYGANVQTRVTGLTDSQTYFSMQAAVGSATHPVLKTSCLYFETISVTIRTMPTVYLAREQLQNKCRYRSTLDHEMKHVDVGRRLAREYAPKIKTAVMNEVRRIGVVGPGPSNQRESIQADMMQMVNHKIAAVIEDMNRDQRARQQAIDTKQEYDRLSKMCGGKF